MAERLCVVMPVYNEQESIGPVLKKWDGLLKTLGIDYEIRPYNDGSKDNSLSVMRETADSIGASINVKDKPNGGHGNTILTGYREAVADGFDWVFQIDSDDEMGPEKFKELWSRRNDYDFLVGIRDGRVQALPRKIISFVSRLCVRLFYGKSVWDVNTPYRLMRVSAFKAFFAAIPLSTFAPNVILSGLAARHELRCFEARVPQHDRMTGEVSIKKWKLLKAAAKSLWQTVAFAFWGSYHKDSGLQKVARLCVNAICLWGIVFCVFRISDPKLAICACALLFAMVAINFAFFVSVRDWCVSHWRICLALIIGIALLERLFVCAVLANGHVAAFQTGDSPSFWREALEMSEGQFPETKSWVAVGIYALSIKFFGNHLVPAVCLNVGTQILTAALLFSLSRRLFGGFAGLCTCSFYLLSPFFASFSIRIYSEHFCHLLIVLELYLLYIWQSHGRYALLKSVCMGILLPIMLWTRAEAGLIMGALLIIVFLWELVSTRCRRWQKVILAGSIVASIVVCALFAGFKINVLYHGTKTCLCSNDNLWPRLYGCNYQYAGKSNPVDIPLICNRYAERNGVDKIELPRHMTCPAELAPLIKEEIATRWREMSFPQICKLILRKEVRTWKVSRSWTIYFNRWWYAADAIFNVILSFVSLLSLWSIFRMSQREETLTPRLLYSILPLLYIMAVFVVVFVVEGNNKYGIIANVMLPLCAAAFLGRNREHSV